MCSTFRPVFGVLAASLGLVACGGGDDAGDVDGGTLGDTSGDALGSDTSATDSTASDGGRETSDVSTDVSSDVSTDTIGTDTTPIGEPPQVTTTFTTSTTSFLGPERGWMQGDGIALLPGDDYTSFRAAGYTLAYAKVRLDAYRTTATLPAKFLTDFDAGFAKVRAAKIKVVLRFVYNEPGEGSTADAAVDLVVGHVGQLAATVAKNRDVIATWQAGLIGQWGEWHDSSSGLDTAVNRKKIIDALVAALPEGRTLQVRTPMFKAAWYPTALTDAQGFDGSAQARIGHHNDCFLADASDMGTYDTPVDTWKSYVAADARFTPLGGESCALFPARTDCTPALAEASKLHWSFMNNHWSDKVVAAWKTQGCYDSIGMHLGYRLSMTEARVTGHVRPGGILALHLAIKNDGWASLYNPRPAHAILTAADGKTLDATLSIDPRRWSAEVTSTFDVRLRIPAGLAEGTYTLSLALPDAAASLATIPEYAVQFANDGVWNATAGTNRITSAVVVDASTIGSVDASATKFVELK